MIKSNRENNFKIFLKFMFWKYVFELTTFFLFLRKAYIGYPQVVVESLLINCVYLTFPHWHMESVENFLSYPLSYPHRFC